MCGTTWAGSKASIDITENQARGKPPGTQRPQGHVQKQRQASGMCMQKQQRHCDQKTVKLWDRLCRPPSCTTHSRPLLGGAGGQAGKASMHRHACTTHSHNTCSSNTDQAPLPHAWRARHETAEQSDNTGCQWAHLQTVASIVGVTPVQLPEVPGFAHTVTEPVQDAPLGSVAVKLMR